MAINNQQGKAYDPDADDANFPYEELDKETQPLRKAASALADLLSQVKPVTSELKGLIDSLKNVSTTDIKKLDVSLSDFKRAFATLTVRNVDNSIFGPSVTDEQLPPILDRYKDFIDETLDIARKAIELNERSKK